MLPKLRFRMMEELNYRKLNADLVMQLQICKQTVQLLEARNLKLIEEAFNHQRIIREQKKIIESFVMNNSVDLNDFLGHLVNGHKQNMTVVTDFIQKMLRKLENLLLNVSSEGQGPVPAAPVPETVTERPRAPRAHRSLSPAAMRDTEESQPLESNDLPTASPSEQFITKRRRNYNAEQPVEPPPPLVEPPAVPAQPPPEPTTLPDGMLSTILETSQDGHSHNISHHLQLPEIHEEEESIFVDENELVASTPNPRKQRSRIINSKTVLSPVDPNRQAVPATRKRTPRVRSRKDLDDSGQDSSCTSSRPKRRAAPSTLAEPSLRDKLRR